MKLKRPEPTWERCAHPDCGLIINPLLLTAGFCTKHEEQWRRRGRVHRAVHGRDHAGATRLRDAPRSRARGGEGLMAGHLRLVEDLPDAALDPVKELAEAEAFLDRLSVNPLLDHGIRASICTLHARLILHSLNSKPKGRA